jgi:ADP-heptose:LPS heptosyltransferase
MRRAVVIADVNIGDTLLLQPSIAALTNRFPGCEIDFVVNHKMEVLVGSDPAIRQTHPVLRGGSSQNRENVERIATILRRGSYDLVVNFCPLITSRALGDCGCPVISPLGFAIDLLRTHRSGEVASMPVRAMMWIDGMADRIPEITPMRSGRTSYPGTRVFVPPDHAARVTAYLAGHGFTPTDPLLFVNPETSNYTTFVDPEIQVEMIHRVLTEHDSISVVLGRGFTYPGVEQRILESVDSAIRRRVVPCPHGLSLEDFAALVDRCQVYVGGDTGPLHIAAAHKTDPAGRFGYSNQLAIVGVFRATDARLYGYDSERDDMIDTSQHARATTIEARPPCKNLTCSLQRLTASCPAIECGQAISARAIADEVLSSVVAAPQRERWWLAG